MTNSFSAIRIVPSKHLVLQTDSIFRRNIATNSNCTSFKTAYSK